MPERGAPVHPPCRSNARQDAAEKNTEAFSRLLSANSGDGLPRSDVAGSRDGGLEMFGRRFVVISCVVALVVCIISIVMASFAVSTYNDVVSELRIARENRGKLCLECSSHLTMREMWDSDRQGECCILLEDLLGIMQKVGAKEVEAQLRRVPTLANAMGTETATENSTAAGQARHRATAHLVINPQTPAAVGGQSGSGIDGAVITAWDANSRASHVTYPLRYLGGYVSIPDNGFYFVYSQVNVAEVFEQPLPEVKAEVLSHSIWRRRRGRSGGEPIAEVLFRSRRSTPQVDWPADSRYGMEASYLGGVVYLEKADEVFVQATSSGKLLKDPTTSFFGIVTL